MLLNSPPVREFKAGSFDTPLVCVAGTYIEPIDMTDAELQLVLRDAKETRYEAVRQSDRLIVQCEDEIALRRERQA